MNVVDSSGWLEYLAGGPNVACFAAIVKATEELVVPTATLYEVFKVMLRETDEDAALEACAAMQKGLLVDLTPRLALWASRLSLQHALPMADATVLATAQDHKAMLWTQDAHFKDLAGVEYFPKR